MLKWLLVLSLTGCRPAPVHLSLDKCWSLSVGDKVEGTALLHAYGGGGCIECGAYIMSRACPKMTGFALADGPVNDAYDQLVKTSRIGSDGYVERAIFLSGDVIPNGATGKPMVRVAYLRAASL